MNINDFACVLAKSEAKKVQVSIAQIKEILSIINRLTHGILYKVIRLL